MSLSQRKWTILALIVITPIGFYTKFYSGPASVWVNHSFSGILYVIFWSLVIFLIVLNANPLKIVAAVLFFTCVLEFLQLWNPPFLRLLRSYFLGRTILGTSFSWSDLVHYSIGSFLSLMLLKFLAQRESGIE